MTGMWVRDDMPREGLGSALTVGGTRSPGNTEGKERI